MQTLRIRLLRVNPFVPKSCPRLRKLPASVVSISCSVATSDGFFNLAIGNQGIWERFCKAAGLDDLLADERFASNPKRVEHYQELAARLERTTATKPSAEWPGFCAEIGVPAGPIYDMAQA